MLFILLATCVSLSLSIIEASQVTLPGKLVFAHVLYRHGDRTPIKPYPTDPYGNISYWPVDWGQLTDRGRQQQYDLGRWLRNRYNTFVGDKFSNNEVYVLSTNVNRTILSAKANLAGLFMLEPKTSWDDVVNVETHDEMILAMNGHCPAYENALLDLKHSDEFKIVRQSYHDVFQYLSKYSGKTYKTIESIQSLYSVLHIEDINHFDLPAWTEAVYPEPLCSLSARSFATATYTRQLARLKAGWLVQNILQRFKDKSEGKLFPNRSLWMYSAHDSTVANVLNTLNVFDWHNPPFTATIMMEMRELNGMYFISIYYKNETNEPYLLAIPNCGTFCPLHKMFEIYNDVLPSGNRNAECIDRHYIAALTIDDFDQSDFTILFFLSVTSFIIFMLILCKILLVKPRRLGYDEIIN